MQKHQAFEAEVVANKDRIFSTIGMGQGELYQYNYYYKCSNSSNSRMPLSTLIAALIENNECVNHEAEVSGFTDSLKEQWEVLLEKIEEKTQKLREANQQQQFNEAVNDMDFWLGEVRRPF